MKKIFLSVAMVAVTFAFAQKKEVQAAFKAAEAGDAATASAQISAADASLNGKIHLLEPSLQEQYYYAKGFSLIKSGKTAEGAQQLAKINDLAKSKIYTGKDASKTKVYYVGKTAADASGVAGLKEETYTPTTTGKVGNIINPVLQTSNQKAVDAYNSKNYEVAGEKFLETYNLLKAAGQENGQLKYNAALSYALGKNNTKAIEVFGSLIDSGYTGVETSYVAKEKKSGEIQSFDKATWELMKKDPNFTDFKVETTPSIEKDLYHTQAQLLADSGNNDAALAFIDKAMKKFPGDARLSQLQGNIYYKSGRTEEFVKNLKDQLAVNPKDAVNWYNLGVLQSKDAKNEVDAEASFNKALELDPKMANAYQNLVYLKMGDDEKALAEYETLRKAGKMDQANKVLDARRARFAKAIPFAEKWYAVDSSNLDVVTLLKGLYQSTRNEAKAAEFKAKEAALKAKK